MLVGPPRPWGAPPDKGNFQRGETPERLHAPMMPKWYPHEALPLLPAEVLRVEQEAASARLAARLAACERRMEARDAQESHGSESMERIALELRQMQEGQRTFSKLSEERFTALEGGLERTKRQDAAVREHLNVLQNDFREFAVTAVGRQRSELELEVSNAFARQSAATEEWRNTLKQRDSQLQAEVQRLTHSVEDASSELVRAQAELRTRISALEAARLGGRDPASPRGEGPSAAAGGGGHMVDYLKQQVDALRNSSEQTGARLAELWARCEGEALSQHALKQDAGTRFESLSRAIATERDNLALRLSQRLEVLESRLGVERSEQAAKQAELHDVMASGDHQVISNLQDLATRFRSELEASERRLQGEVSTLRSNVEADLAQFSAARATEDEARRSSLANLVQRLDGSTERHVEASNSLKQELDISFRDLREALRSESSARIETERKLEVDTSRAAKTLASELGGLQMVVRKQGELVAAELDRMRFDNSDRADRLSRYVDEKVAMVQGDPSQSRLANDTVSLEARLNGVKAAAEQQALLAQERLDACAEDMRNQLSKAQNSWSQQVVSARRDTDRSGKTSDRQVLVAQDELKARLEAYVKHFDSSIASVQAAILRPNPNGGGAMTSPRPQAQALGMLPTKPPPGYTGWSSAGLATPAPAPLRAPPQREHWRPAAEWQSEEMKSVVDGLRVHEEADLASQVRASLSRGEAVVVKDVFERDGRRWASLGGRGGRGGFVLAFSEYGTPLLEPVQSLPKQSQDLFSGGTALSPLVPALQIHQQSYSPSKLAQGLQGCFAASAELSAELALGERDAQRNSASSGRLLGPLVPLTATGEAVQQLAEEVASGACQFAAGSEDGVDLRNMVRDMLVRGVVSGDFGQALAATEQADRDDAASAQEVQSPGASVGRGGQAATGSYQSSDDDAA